MTENDSRPVSVPLEAENSSAPTACPACGAATEAATGRAAVWADQGIVVVEDIPTQLCPACGEQAWAPDVAVRVERLIAGCDVPAAAGQTLIPVVAFQLARGGCGTGGETAAARLQPVPATEDDADATHEFHASDICLCPDCAVATEPAVVRSVLSGAHGWTAVEGIPARVCPACGERFYDEATTWQLVSLTSSGPPAEPAPRKIPCRILSYVPQPQET